MNIRPSLLTAAIAGIIAAVAWPFLWERFGGPAADGVGLIVATLLVIALPAHALVVGFVPPEGGRRSLDTALLKRIGVWLAAVAGVVVLRAAIGL